MHLVHQDAKELLEQIGIEFDIITSDVDETTLITQPDEYVKYLSRIKAQAVWDMVKDDDDYRNEDVVVIGADTIVSHKGHILTKPKDTGNAFDILKELAGDCHQVYTGVTLIKNNNVVSNFAEKTDVYCNDISDNEIREYISTDSRIKQGLTEFRGDLQHLLENDRRCL